MSKCVPVILALAVTGVATTGVASAASGSDSAAANSIGLRLVEAPVTSDSGPQSKIYIVARVGPGAVLHRQIQISNTTSSTISVALYASAASMDKGAFLVSAGHTPNPLSSWTSVAPTSSAIASGNVLTGNVTIVVPRDAAPGEQYGVVWAETRSLPSSGGGVVQVSRVGIRVYLSVGTGGAVPANFTIAPLTVKRSLTGQPVVLTTIHNTGGWALSVSGTLRLTAGPGGLTAGPLHATLGSTLAVGQREPVTISLDKRLPLGPWDAQVSVRSGLLEHSARGRIVFPATPSPGLRWGYPAIVGSLVLLLLGGTAFVAYQRRRLAHR
jgi:hypothetical protein